MIQPFPGMVTSPQGEWSHHHWRKEVELFPGEGLWHYTTHNKCMMGSAVIMALIRHTFGVVSPRECTKCCEQLPVKFSYRSILGSQPLFM